MSKVKGSNAERELFHIFWKSGWACSRVAGSGSNRYPSPDLIAGNGGRLLAIECKCSKYEKIYLPIEEVEALLEYSGKLGAETWIAAKFDGWYFVSVEDLERTQKSVIVSKKAVMNKGLIFEELTKGF